MMSDRTDAWDAKNAAVQQGVPMPANYGQGYDPRMVGQGGRVEVAQRKDSVFARLEMARGAVFDLVGRIEQYADRIGGPEAPYPQPPANTVSAAPQGLMAEAHNQLDRIERIVQLGHDALARLERHLP